MQTMDILRTALRDRLASNENKTAWLQQRNTSIHTRAPDQRATAQAHSVSKLSQLQGSGRPRRVNANPTLEELSREIAADPAAVAAWQALHAQTAAGLARMTAIEDDMRTRERGTEEGKASDVLAQMQAHGHDDDTKDAAHALLTLSRGVRGSGHGQQVTNANRAYVEQQFAERRAWLDKTPQVAPLSADAALASSAVLAPFQRLEDYIIAISNDLASNVSKRTAALAMQFTYALRANAAPLSTQMLTSLLQKLDACIATLAQRRAQPTAQDNVALIDEIDSALQNARRGLVTIATNPAIGANARAAILRIQGNEKPAAAPAVAATNAAVDANAGNAANPNIPPANNPGGGPNDDGVIPGVAGAPPVVPAPVPQVPPVPPRAADVAPFGQEEGGPEEAEGGEDDEEDEEEEEGDEEDSSGGEDPPDQPPPPVPDNGERGINAGVVNAGGTAQGNLDRLRAAQAPRTGLEAELQAAIHGRVTRAHARALEQLHESFATNPPLPAGPQAGVAISPSSLAPRQLPKTLPPASSAPEDLSKPYTQGADRRLAPRGPNIRVTRRRHRFNANMRSYERSVAEPAVSVGDRRGRVTLAPGLPGHAAQTMHLDPDARVEMIDPDTGAEARALAQLNASLATNPPLPAGPQAGVAISPLSLERRKLPNTLPPASSAPELVTDHIFYRRLAPRVPGARAGRVGYRDHFDSNLRTRDWPVEDPAVSVGDLRGRVTLAPGLPDYAAETMHRDPDARMVMIDTWPGTSMTSAEIDKEIEMLDRSERYKRIARDKQARFIRQKRLLREAMMNAQPASPLEDVGSQPSRPERALPKSSPPMLDEHASLSTPIDAMFDPHKLQARRDAAIHSPPLAPAQWGRTVETSARAPLPANELAFERPVHTADIDPGRMPIGLSAAEKTAVAARAVEEARLREQAAYEAALRDAGLAPVVIPPSRPPYMTRYQYEKLRREARKSEAFVSRQVQARLTRAAARRAQAEAEMEAAVAAEEAAASTVAAAAEELVRAGQRRGPSLRSQSNKTATKKRRTGEGRWPKQRRVRGGALPPRARLDPRTTYDRALAYEENLDQAGGTAPLWFNPWTYM